MDRTWLKKKATPKESFATMTTISKKQSTNNYETI